jgi:DNA polymerase (family X)
MERTQNKYVADRLREAATLLEQQGANKFRVNAYRRAAGTIESLEHDVSIIVDNDGLHGLTALPGIGPMIGGAILEMIRTGHWTQLERLRGALDSEALFSKVPGVGPKLAANIIDGLHVDSLEALETAVHDGRLAKLPGFGERRVAIIRSALAEMLGRKRWGMRTERHEPSVKALLDVDREYRERAEAGKLQKIAPRRFNPNNETWLPVLHTERGRWHFTVFYSNTALAHRLNRNHDWVVIYFHTDSYSEGQRTVVTETQGAMHGKRVVRGRERECEEYYAPPLFNTSSAA